MKPYLVEISTIAVVMAEDHTHAEDVGRHHAREAMGDDDRPRVRVMALVTKLDELVDQWDGRCLPCGGDGNSTLAELLAGEGVK